MASTTTHLGLTKPANGEYQDAWDTPINGNFDILDTEVHNVKSEVQTARGNKSSLSERLNNGLDADGNLLATPEVEKGRISQITDGHHDYLYDRLHAVDMELLDLRGQKASLLENMDILANEFGLPGPVAGPQTGGGDANFLTWAGSVFTVEGDPTPVIFNINGRKQVCRIDATTDLNGEAPGTYFVKAEVGSGRTVVSSTTGEVGGTDTDELQDTSSDFVVAKVQAGDLLEISSGANQGQYVVKQVVDANNLKIYGKWNQALSSQTYTIKDMLHPTIGYDSAKAAGTIYIGEVEFDGAGITDGFAYNYKGKYDSSWTSIDVTAVPVFTQVFNHNLGEIPHNIQIFASQYSDGETSEPLALAGVDSDYAITFTDGGDGDSLSTSGGPYMTRSVKVKVTRRQITIKNVRNNHFYTDFDDAAQDTGYLKVFIRR